MEKWALLSVPGLQPASFLPLCLSGPGTLQIAGFAHPRGGRSPLCILPPVLPPPRWPSTCIFIWGSLTHALARTPRLPTCPGSPWQLAPASPRLPDPGIPSSRPARVRSAGTRLWRRCRAGVGSQGRKGEPKWVVRGQTIPWEPGKPERSETASVRCALPGPGRTRAVLRVLGEAPQPLQ